MSKKFDEQLTQINEDVFSYFDIVNPHPEITAYVINSNIELLEFINPTECMESFKAASELLKSDHNGRWERIFDKLDYISDNIFLNIISQASHTTVLIYDEEEKRNSNVCAFYNGAFNPLFLDKLCEDSKIKDYVDNLKNDPNKVTQLCQQSFYFFILAKNNELLDNHTFKSIFMNYFRGQNKIIQNDSIFNQTKEYQLANFSIEFLDYFTKSELKEVTKQYFSYYLKNYTIEKNINYFDTQDFIQNFIDSSNKFFSNKHYNSSDYRGYLITFYRTMYKKGEDTHLQIKQCFDKITPNYGHSLIKCLLSELKDEQYEPIRTSLFDSLKPSHLVKFLEHHDYYSSYLENLSLFQNSFWTKVKADTISYEKIFNLFKDMQEHDIKGAYPILPFIFKKEDSIKLINEYINKYPKEMFRFPVFETLLEPQSLNDSLHKGIHLKIEDNIHIQESVIKTIIKHFKKNENYIIQYHEPINEILSQVFTSKSMNYFFSNLGSYNFDETFSDILMQHFPNIIIEKYSPNNDENFLFIQKKPKFLEQNFTNRNDIAKQKVQNFFWQNRTKEFNEIFSFIFKKEWEKNLETNQNKELYEKFYFENAIIKETPKKSKKLKI